MNWVSSPLKEWQAHDLLEVKVHPLLWFFHFLTPHCFFHTDFPHYAAAHSHSVYSLSDKATQSYVHSIFYLSIFLSNYQLSYLSMDQSVHLAVCLSVLRVFSQSRHSHGTGIKVILCFVAVVQREQGERDSVQDGLPSSLFMRGERDLETPQELHV